MYFHSVIYFIFNHKLGLLNIRNIICINKKLFEIIILIKKNEKPLYIIAVILIIIWVISFLVYHVTGGLIHILLVIAVIAIILGVIRRA